MPTHRFSRLFWQKSKTYKTKRKSFSNLPHNPFNIMPTYPPRENRKKTMKISDDDGEIKKIS
jgi:hypothetical protein